MTEEINWDDIDWGDDLETGWYFRGELVFPDKSDPNWNANGEYEWYTNRDERQNSEKL